jgi:hypothetical protein
MKDTIMFSFKRIALSAVAAAVIFGLNPDGLVRAQGEQEPVMSARGGLLAKAERYQFEVVFYPTGVRVFPSTVAGSPVETSRLSGIVTFFHPNSPRPWFSRPLRSSGGPGQPATSLELGIGLGNAPATGGRAVFEITGLPDAAGSTVAFTVPLRFAAAPVAAQPEQPRGGAPVVPRYVYGSGPTGYGYYEYNSPGPALPRASGYTTYGSPMRFPAAGHEVGPNHRDWSTGRNLPLAKPWLRPMD